MHSWGDFYTFIKDNRALVQAQLEAAFQRHLPGHVSDAQTAHLVTLLLDEMYRLPKGNETLNEVVDDTAALWMTQYGLSLDDEVQQLTGITYDTIERLALESASSV